MSLCQTGYSNETELILWNDYDVFKTGFPTLNLIGSELKCSSNASSLTS